MTDRRRTDLCATCGHARSEHVYEEGACRPGFLCPSECEAFIEKRHCPECGAHDFGARQGINHAVGCMAAIGESNAPDDILTALVGLTTQLERIANVLEDVHQPDYNCLRIGAV